MAKAKGKKSAAGAGPAEDADISEWEAASTALYEACLPPSPDSSLRDIYGNPARVTYNDFMRRTLRLERATFKLANKARSDGHPHDTLERLRLVLGVLRRNPSRNDKDRIDVVDLGELAPSKVPDEFNLADHIVAAGVEALQIKEHRDAERTQDDSSSEDDDGNERRFLMHDSACIAIAKALDDGAKRPKGMLAAVRRRSDASDRTLSNRRKRMRLAGLLWQAKPHASHELTDEGRAAFGLKPK